MYRATRVRPVSSTLKSELPFAEWTGGGSAVWRVTPQLGQKARLCAKVHYQDGAWGARRYRAAGPVWPRRRCWVCLMMTPLGFLILFCAHDRGVPHRDRGEKGGQPGDGLGGGHRNRVRNCSRSALHWPPAGPAVAILLPGSHRRPRGVLSGQPLAGKRGKRERRPSPKVGRLSGYNLLTFSVVPERWDGVQAPQYLLELIDSDAGW